MYTDDAIAPPTDTDDTITKAEDGHVTSPYRLLKVDGTLELPVGIDSDGTGLLQRDCEVAPMSGHEEDMLSNQRTKDPMVRLIASCTVLLGGVTMPYAGRSNEQKIQMINMVKKLTIADQTFLMFAIRRRSFLDGDTYRFPVLCTNKKCKVRRTNHKVDLSELAIHPAPSDLPQMFEFRLPMSGRIARYRLMRTEDSERILALQKQQEESRSSVQIYGRLVDVDGKKLGSFDDLKGWSTADREALRGDIDDHDHYGVDLRITVEECPSCDMTRAVEIDISPSFFRPTISK